MKNSILLLLVILILHFLIKNALTERFVVSGQYRTDPPEQDESCGGDMRNSMTSEPSPAEPLGTVELAAVDKKAAAAAEPSSVTSALASGKLKYSSAGGDVAGGGTDEEDDLYKYVFGAECPAADSASVPDNGGPACSGKDMGDKFAKPQLVCTSSKQDGDKSQAVKKRGDGGGFGDKSGHMIVGQYSNEKALNGGVVFDGLMGFDGADTQYQELF